MYRLLVTDARQTILDAIIGAEGTGGPSGRITTRAEYVISAERHEHCEVCDRVIHAGAEVYVVPIGGGYAVACGTHEEPDSDTTFWRAVAVLT